VPYVGSIYGLKRGRSSGGTNPPKKAPAMPDKGLKRPVVGVPNLIGTGGTFYVFFFSHLRNISISASIM